MQEISHSKLVDGYRRAFIDSAVDAEPSCTPQFVSNSNGNKVLTQIENELRGMLINVHVRGLHYVWWHTASEGRA